MTRTRFFFPLTLDLNLQFLLCLCQKTHVLLPSTLDLEPPCSSCYARGQFSSHHRQPTPQSNAAILATYVTSAITFLATFLSLLVYYLNELSQFGPYLLIFVSRISLHVFCHGSQDLTRPQYHLTTCENVKEILLLSHVLRIIYWIK